MLYPPKHPAPKTPPSPSCPSPPLNSPNRGWAHHCPSRKTWAQGCPRSWAWHRGGVLTPCSEGPAPAPQLGVPGGLGGREQPAPQQADGVGTGTELLCAGCRTALVCVKNKKKMALCLITPLPVSAKAQMASPLRADAVRGTDPPQPSQPRLQTQPTQPSLGGF